MIHPQPFPAAWLRKYNYEQLEYLAKLTIDDDFTDPAAERLMLREEKIARFMKSDERRNRNYKKT